MTGKVNITTCWHILVCILIMLFEMEGYVIGKQPI